MSVLNLINKNEKLNNSKLLTFPFNVIDLNESQKEALKEIEKNDLITIIGAAGTGKSSTISAIACHFINQNKKVLICSKSEHAVSVITDKINNIGAGLLCYKGGKKEQQIELTSKLLDILEKKIDLTKEEINIFKYFTKEENIKKLKNKKAENITNLLNDIEQRQQLILQIKNCMLKNKTKKDEIMQKIDFTPILNAIPCFAVTTFEISNLLPLKEEMFDVVIFDESSEIDIASALPCLYRAKKAVIVGDNKQLVSLNFLDNKKNESLLNKNEVPEELKLIWNYRNNSLFDFAQFYAQKCILLNIQYRMPENLFNFANNKFYNGSIKSYKKADKEALKKVFVENGKTLENKTCNFAEAKQIIIELKKEEYKNKSIFVLSPFKNQVDLIQKLVNEVIEHNNNIKVMTINESQGNEADVVLMSWTIAENTPHQSMTFINNENRFNVGITRAKNKMINFYSTKRLKGLISEYLCSIPE